MKIVKMIVMLLAFGAVLFASEQRIEALGGNAGFWADDDLNIALFPHTINNWNIAQTDGADFGVIWGDETKWGFSGGEANDLVNLYWGNGTYGAMFGLNMTPENTEVGTEADAYNEFDFGFGMEFMGGETGLFYSMDNDESAFTFNWRNAFNFWLFENYITTFNYVMPEAEGVDAEYIFTQDFFTGIDIAENTKGIFAMGFEYGNAGDGYGDYNMTFGVETAMNDWATLRAGFTKGYDLINSVGYDVDAAFGLGFNYGGFLLDMNIGTDLFTNPVQKVVGFEALGATAFNITYTW
ncbi:MAG: hypothetical protein H8E71_04495 [Candidatus Marinimicrobia bacterium]|nr:hypothetical protein [Candidatus Neomarinimicrobiota bacterium]MBL7108741.1 hypothetical protein [Candidatus Neomarinimicrobiota bacterium]